MDVAVQEINLPCPDCRRWPYKIIDVISFVKELKNGFHLCRGRDTRVLSDNHSSLIGNTDSTIKDCSVLQHIRNYKCNGLGCTAWNISILVWQCVCLCKDALVEYLLKCRTKGESQGKAKLVSVTKAIIAYSSRAPLTSVSRIKSATSAGVGAIALLTSLKP